MRLGRDVHVEMYPIAIFGTEKFLDAGLVELLQSSGKFVFGTYNVGKAGVPRSCKISFPLKITDETIPSGSYTGLIIKRIPRHDSSLSFSFIQKPNMSDSMHVKVPRDH